MPPTHNGTAKWKITPWTTGCPGDVVARLFSGANAGASWSENPSGGSDYVWYQGAKDGTDSVWFHIGVSGCAGSRFHVRVNGIPQPDTFTQGDPDSYPYKTSVGWGSNLMDNGECDAPWAPTLKVKGSEFRRSYQRQCVDDPINGGLGRFETHATDASLPAAGASFSFNRSYTSGDPYGGDLGYGWHEPYGSYLVINTNSSPNKVTAYLGSGQQILFTKNPDGSWASPSWTTAKLTYASNVYKIVQTDRTVWAFDSSGALRSVTDRNGQTATVSGWTHWPTQVSLSNGKIVTFTNDSSGRITKLTLPDGRFVSYAYNAAGELASVTDLRGGVTSYTYDAYHRLLTLVDPNGHTAVTNVYGDWNRVSQQTDALGHATTYAWTQDIGTATATDPRGNRWTDVYTADGLLARETDPLGNVSSYTYDAATRDPLTYTDPLGHTVQLGYDAAHNLTQTTLPGPITTSATYTAGGELASSTNGRGNTTSYTYDASGNPTLITQPGGATIGLAYNASGLVTGITDQASKTTSFAYDTSGNRTSATSPLGNKTSYGYDSSGRRTSLVDPRGNVTGANPNDYKTTATYNAANQVASVTDPLGHATSYTYDAVGNLTGRTDPNGHQWHYAYDAANRLTQVTAPDLSTTSYGYDAAGNLISRTDANGHATTYSYDADNRLIDIADPLGRHWDLGYDADSNLTSLTTPSTGTISYAYDALGRRTSASYSDSTATVSVAYDANGNRASMTDGAGTLTYTYDNRDRLTQTTRGADTFAYTYDPVGRVASRTYPDAMSTAYAYDSDGRLTSATTGANTTGYTYDPAAELTQTTLPNAVAETYSYNHAGLLTQLTDGFRSFTYGYDPAGNVTSRLIDSTATSYAYDTLDRLTDATGATTIHYGYDAVGNRTSQQTAAGTTSYSYDAGDQLQSTTGPSGTTNFSYDANGNQTSAGAWTYGFSLAGELTTAGNGTLAASYTYDGGGNRLSSTSGGSTTSYVWDANYALPQLALERDVSGASLRAYTYGLGRVGMTTSTTTAYYSSDALGTTTELSGSGGSLLGRYDTSPFGDNPTSSNVDPSVAGNPFGFTGEYQDPTTGLYNLRARQYDPTSGRFLSPDPLGPQAGAGIYVYAGNSPTGQTDPSGLRHTPSCSLLCHLGGGYVKCQEHLSCAMALPFLTAGAGEATLALRGETAAEEAAVAPRLGFTRHGADRLAERGVRTPDALDAFRNPLRTGEIEYDALGRPAQKLIGQRATLVINPETNQIITGWSTSSGLAATLLRQAEGGG